MCQVDRSKSFEEALSKYRKLDGIKKDILKNRKRSALSKTLHEVTKQLNILKRKSRNISSEDDEFLEEVNWVSQEITNLKTIQVSGSPASEHRDIAVSTLETGLKNILSSYQKSIGKARRRIKLSSKPVHHVKLQPVVQEFDQKDISNEEEERYLAEALALKEDFDEVALIESKVTDIAQLQHKIAENINLQAEVADNIQDNVQQANENVRDGNEQILEATRRQSDWRVFSMIFLLGCSLTLLLLDSYK